MGATNLSLIKNMHTGATCLALKSLSSNANNDVDALQSFRFSHLVSSKMRVQELSSTQLVWCVNSYTAKHVAAVEAKTFRARFSSAHEAAQFKREFNAAVLNRKSIHTVFTALRALSSTIRSCATSSHVEKRDAVYGFIYWISLLNVWSFYFLVLICLIKKFSIKKVIFVRLNFIKMRNLSFFL